MSNFKKYSPAELVGKPVEISGGRERNYYGRISRVTPCFFVVRHAGFDYHFSLASGLMRGGGYWNIRRADVITDEQYDQAIDTRRVERELKEKRLAIIAAFQEDSSVKGEIIEKVYRVLYPST